MPSYIGFSCRKWFTNAKIGDLEQGLLEILEILESRDSDLFGLPSFCTGGICTKRSLPFTFTVTQPFRGPAPDTNSYCKRPSCQLTSCSIKTTAETFDIEARVGNRHNNSSSSNSNSSNNNNNNNNNNSSSSSSNNGNNGNRLIRMKT